MKLHISALAATLALANTACSSSSSTTTPEETAEAAVMPSTVEMEESEATNEELVPIEDEEDVGDDMSMETQSDDILLPNSTSNFPIVEEITAENYLDIINFVFENIGSERVVNLLDIIDDIERQATSENNDFTNLNIQEAQYTRVQICPDGGRYLAGAGLISAQAEDYRIEECSIDGLNVSGSYNLIQPGNQYASLFISVTFEDGITQTFNGSFREFDFGDDERIPTTSIDGTFATRIDDVRYIEEHNSQNSTNLGEEPDFNGDVYAERIWIIDHDISISLPSGDHPSTPIRVTLPGGSLLKQSGEANFTTGQIDITLFEGPGRPNSNKISIQTDNGNPETFDVLLFETSDVVTTFTINWDDVTPLLPPRQRTLERPLIF